MYGHLKIQGALASGFLIVTGLISFSVTFVSCICSGLWMVLDAVRSVNLDLENGFSGVIRNYKTFIHK